MTSSFTTTIDDVICRIQSLLFAQVKVNDYKAKLTKDAKQNKAKLSNAKCGGHTLSLSFECRKTGCGVNDCAFKQVGLL